jgi:nitrate reductase gamma subunit
MSKKKISQIVMAAGIIIILIAFVFGLIGFPKAGFGRAKIALGILGALILIAGLILFLRREKTDSLLKILKPRSRPELIFLSIAALAGLLFCIFIPYGAGFDESAHVIRVFDVANLS